MIRRKDKPEYREPDDAHPARRAFVGAVPLAAGWLMAESLPAAAQQATRAPRTGRVLAEEYGAAGDGVRDDSLGIQRAVDAVDKAGGGVVLLGNKTYRVDAPIEIDPTKVSLSGARAVLDGRRVPGKRSCILVRVRPGSPRYDQAPQVVEGLVIQGAGVAAGQTGIAFSTAVADLSSRIVLRNVAVRDVATGLDFGARTYLCQGYSLQVTNVETAVRFSSGEDAGENITFYGCTFANTSGTAVVNASGAIASFYGCSFDYCRRWFSGSGLNQFFGCWFEKQRVDAAEDIPFELTAGNLDFVGGGIQISGIGMEKGNQNPHMFVARDRLARITITDTFAWNWRTATGELAGGDGTIVVRNLGGQGRKFVPAVLKNDDRHNLFGPAARLDGSELSLPCWIAGQGATRVSPTEITWGNARGSATIAKRGAQGGPCLQVRKGVGRGTIFTFDALAPIPAGSGASLRLSCALASRATDAPVWFQVAFSQVGMAGPDGLPRITNREVWGETELRPDPGASPVWHDLAWNSQDLDQTSPALGYAPAWATHVHLSVNLVSLDAGADLLLSKLGSWAL